MYPDVGTARADIDVGTARADIGAHRGTPGVLTPRPICTILPYSIGGRDGR